MRTPGRESQRSRPLRDADGPQVISYPSANGVGATSVLGQPYEPPGPHPAPLPPNPKRPSQNPTPKTPKPYLNPITLTATHIATLTQRIRNHKPLTRNLQTRKTLKPLRPQSLKPLRGSLATLTKRLRRRRRRCLQRRWLVEGLHGPQGITGLGNSRNASTARLGV